MSDELKKDSYEKPVLTVVELKADEVLIIGCTNAGTGGMAKPSCLIDPCAGDGS